MEANAKHPTDPSNRQSPNTGWATLAHPAFEYQAWVRNSWSTIAIYDEESKAVGHAQRDLLDEQHHRVRVRQIWPEQAETLHPRVIFTREGEATNGPYSSELGQPPLNPPTCHEPHDLFEPSARLTLNRLFRDYCDQHQVLVGDILHNHRYLNRLLTQSSLIGQAINRTAKIQAKSGDLLRRRRQTIMNVVQALPHVTQALPHNFKPELAEAELRLRITALQDTGDLPSLELANQKRLLGAALHDVAATRKSTAEKLCWAIELYDQNHHALLNQQLDLYLADLCYSTDITDTITGLTSNLGETLIRLLLLAEGADVTEGNKRPTNNQALNIAIARLQTALKRRQLPITRHHLIDSVSDALEHSGALEKRDRHLDDQLYRMIVETAARYYRMLAEPDFIHALTRRFSRHSDVAAADVMAAVRHVGAILEQPGLSIIYWATLYKMYDDQDMRRQLITNIRETLERTIDLMALLPGNMGHKARISRISLAYHAIAKMPIAPEWRRSTLQLIDEAMLLYLEEQDFLKEKPGNPDLFRDQAFRMVDFMKSGLLPDGQASQRLRSRIITMIQRDGFDHIFVRGIRDKTMAEAALRAFKQRLSEAGLQRYS